MYEELIHPNAMKTSEYEDTKPPPPLTKSEWSKERRKKFNTCKSCMKRFDTYLMKPFFIHNYEKELIDKKEEFMELFMKEGDVWEKMYMEEKFDASMVEENRQLRGYSVLKQIEAHSLMKSALRDSTLRNSNITTGQIDHKLIRKSSLLTT